MSIPILWQWIEIHKQHKEIWHHMTCAPILTSLQEEFCHRFSPSSQRIVAACPVCLGIVVILIKISWRGRACEVFGSRGRVLTSIQAAKETEGTQQKTSSRTTWVKDGCSKIPNYREVATKIQQWFYKTNVENKQRHIFKMILRSNCSFPTHILFILVSA